MPVRIDQQVKPPTRSTLRSYGLTAEAWMAICRRQGWRCPVCSEPLGARKLAVDHEHVKGFKAHKKRRGRRVRSMSQEERVGHVRGVLHAYCNRFVRSWLTIARAERILRYLEGHERRRDK